ncbi:hypothetical protein ACFYQT_40305 [Streptomyces tibetensis]|uniref:Uncharacterized protein n=1 Tax=Streptomyces tibetensis TaxID=2382123 RepID=A0ABW6N8N9_9ACTN
MDLISDTVFYGLLVDAGLIPRDRAAQLLAEASQGLLDVRGARQAIDTWQGVRERMRSLRDDVTAVQDAARSEGPVPERLDENQRARQKARLLEQFRRRYGNDS